LLRMLCMLCMPCHALAACRVLRHGLAADSKRRGSIPAVAPARSQVFACTVGLRPSKAPFYVNDTEEVLGVLSCIAEKAAHAVSQ
jgi:hypothetical protein